AARVAAGPAGGEPVAGGAAGPAAGCGPLAARSAIRPLTASADIDGGSCSTTVRPAGSAARPAGEAHSKSSSARARARAGIAPNLTEFGPMAIPPARNSGPWGIALLFRDYPIPRRGLANPRTGNRTPRRWAPRPNMSGPPATDADPTRRAHHSSPNAG